ncbi:MAG: hypothetical protein ABH856_00745 [Patescibacteria group bacterium]|nr:hypothetical protein [Patescibacteria group bacterium]
MTNYHSEKPEELKKVQEQSYGKVDSAMPGASEIAEQIEAVEIPKEVTEKKEKAQERKAASTAKAKAYKAKQLKAELLKNPPTEEKMRKEVDRAISKEVGQLEKQRNRILHNPANRNFYQLNIIVQKLRELKHILANLAQATYEMLKNLWLRFVHGIY